MNRAKFKANWAKLVTIEPARRPLSPWRLSVNIRFALLVIALGFAGNGFAKSSPPGGEITLELDRPACKIEFSLGAALHTVSGTSEVKEGTLRLDVASRKISGQVVVDVQAGMNAIGVCIGRFWKVHGIPRPSSRQSISPANWRCRAGAM
jgi:hypothetical protein